MTTEGFKRKLTTIFSADVAGYSRLMGEDEAATVKTLTAYRGVMGELIKQHGGRVVDSPGDNILAEFTSVVDAVQCGVAVQKELKSRNAELPENRRMEFRIGINLGDVIEEEDRIYGDGVNIAARLEALADPGGICISKTAFDQIETKLPLGYEYLGEQEVKNIAKPVGTYRVLMEPRVTVAEEIEKENAVPVWRSKAILAGGVALVLVVIAALIWNSYFRPPPMEVASVERMAFPLPDRPSIAVLPFVNMSGDPEQEYIADGMTENITTALSKIREMFVIARTSTMTYKGKPTKVTQVSEELGVRYVLEGSVQKEGDRVRITAQLVDAIKGHHLWAERYDRDMKGFFDLLDEITKEIGTALQVKLTWGDYARSIASTDNLEAWGYFIKGYSHLLRLKKEDNVKARDLCERAANLDPEYVPALRIIAHTHLADVRFGWSKSPRQSMERAIEFAQKALKIDESDAGVHALLSSIYRIKRQHEKSIAEGERAISLDPNFAPGFYVLAYALYYSGKFEEAIAMIKTAMRLHGPYFPPHYLSTLGHSHRMLGRYEEALSAYKKLFELSLKGKYPELWAHYALTTTYIGLGRLEDARKHADEILRLNPKFSLESVRKIAQFKDPSHLERSLDALRKAGIPEHPPLPLPAKPSIAVLPFTNMSEDPKQEYFVDGMTEDLITDLSKISGLFVIARNSVFQYKGKPVEVKRISRELGVRYLLEGSVRRADNQVRINAQLIDATTREHLWAERYDGEMDDIFALQDKINQKIVKALAVKLTSGEQEQVDRKETDNIAAYDAFLQGWAHYLRLTPDDYAKAVGYFKKATELDPNYGRAYAGLAMTYFRCADLGWAEESLGKEFMTLRFLARKYSEMALDNPTSLAYQVASKLSTNMYQNEDALAKAGRAITLEPNDANAQITMAEALIHAGRAEEAVDFIKAAMRLDPHHPGLPLYFLGLAHFCLGQLEEAVTLLERALKFNPEVHSISLELAAAYAHLGRDEEARAALEKYTREWWERGVKFTPELRLIMPGWSINDPEVVERLANGLLKAGLAGEPSGYYKISKENQLTVEEINKLIFGRTESGFHLYTGFQYWIDCNIEGECTSRGAYGRDSIRSWIEGDMLCRRWRKGKGAKFCGIVFRNAEGTRERMDEYLWIFDHGIYPFSVVD